MVVGSGLGSKCVSNHVPNKANGFTFWLLGWGLGFIMFLDVSRHLTNLTVPMVLPFRG